ncbi:MAG: amidohydrolase family protein [Sphingobium sp.]
MASVSPIAVNPENEWRLNSREPQGWARTARPGPGAKRKYFMVSCDTHLNTSPRLYVERLDKKWHHKLPRVEVRDGVKYMIQEGARPTRIPEWDLEGEDLVRSKAGGDNRHEVEVGDAEALDRIRDQRLDGVDAEVIFPGGPAFLMWSDPDIDFVYAQIRVWNDWAMEVCGDHLNTCNPAAALAPADLDATIAEVERCAKLGYRVLTLPCKPIWGPGNVDHVNYNLAHFDPLWAAIQDHDMTATFHVSTGMDPRLARGNGGAIINYVVHSLAPTIEPMVNLCSSGVFERFPMLRAGTIEANAGWVPWMLQSMDESYLKHHMWVRPKLKALPSDYYRAHCFASFGEDRAAVELCESHGLQDNLMWANDYPHHEGSWPHSAQAVERTFGDLVTEETRAKLLGLNAARIFRFDVPADYRD